MITDGSTAAHSLPKEFTSTGSHAASNPRQPPPPAAAPKSQEAAPINSKPPSSSAAARRPSEPSRPEPSPVRRPSETSAGPRIINTAVMKGEHGIGLDLVKSSNGRACIQKLKEMPPGVVNPASLCTPAILPGDIIVGVNGKPSGLFADTIKMIRALENGRPINLQLERGG